MPINYFSYHGKVSTAASRCQRRTDRLDMKSVGDASKPFYSGPAPQSTASHSSSAYEDHERPSPQTTMTVQARQTEKAMNCCPAHVLLIHHCGIQLRQAIGMVDTGCQFGLPRVLRLWHASRARRDFRAAPRFPYSETTGHHMRMEQLMTSAIQLCPFLPGLRPFIRLIGSALPGHAL